MGSLSEEVEASTDGADATVMTSSAPKPALLTFGALLDLAAIDRSQVRLLRHQDNRYTGFQSPYVLWRDHRERFEAYQETQAIGDAADLRAPI